MRAATAEGASGSPGAATGQMQWFAYRVRTIYLVCDFPNAEEIVTVRAQPLDQAQLREMATALERIEKAALAAAEDCRVDAHVERDLRGRLPFIGIRLHGFLPARDMPVEPGRDR